LALPAATPYLPAVIDPQPIVLQGHGIRLEPMTPQHRDRLAAAASDGRLWELWFTAIPEPQGMSHYIADALDGQTAGHMLPWVVCDAATGAVIGSTRYHDIMPAIDRVEIGYTRYAQSRQRTHVNTTCKLPLLRTPSRAWVARWWGCGPTTSTSARSARSRRSARRRT
jgi:RimJ/RimL family protein N-acetyltransferase